MGKIYLIEAGYDGGKIAQAYGDLAAMAYHARSVKETMAGGPADRQYAAHIIEVNEVGGTGERYVARIQGDAETVAYILTKRLSAERKASAPAVEVSAAE